ncbi:hypothetical protein OfM2_17640 [Lactovum odontotermitis]
MATLLTSGDTVVAPYVVNPLEFDVVSGRVADFDSAAGLLAGREAFVGFIRSAAPSGAASVPAGNSGVISASVTSEFSVLISSAGSGVT